MDDGGPVRPWGSPKMIEPPSNPYPPKCLLLYTTKRPFGAFLGIPMWHKQMTWTRVISRSQKHLTRTKYISTSHKQLTDEIINLLLKSGISTKPNTLAPISVLLSNEYISRYPEKNKLNMIVNKTLHSFVQLDICWHIFPKSEGL